MPQQRVGMRMIKDILRLGARHTPDKIVGAGQHGSVEELASVQQQLTQRPGPLVSIERLCPSDSAVPLERLVVERAPSLNRRRGCQRQLDDDGARGPPGAPQRCGRGAAGGGVA